MFASSLTPSPLVSLETWASQMRRNSSRIVPVSPNPHTNLTPRHQKNSSDTRSSTHTGAIARQILRHRSFSFQEFSQRYADPTKDLSFVCREARLQDPKNRQNSIATDDPMLQIEWERAQQRAIYAARREYEWAIANGIAKEQARAVLPEGLIESRLYMNGTLRSWVHFIELRSANGTQLEHQEVARACAEVIAKVFPMSAEFVDTTT